MKKTVLLHRGRKNEENFQIVSVNGRSWKIMKGVEVQVPDSMVESQLTGLLQELESRLMSQGASLSDYLQMAGMTEEDLRSHARENALELSLIHI